MLSYVDFQLLQDAGRVYPYLLNPLSGSKAVSLPSIEAEESVYKITGRHFGMSVSISGNLLLIGSPGAIIGSAHLYYQDEGGQWQFSQIILDDPPEDTFSESKFGYSVAINLHYALVGMPKFDEPIPGGEPVTDW